MDCCDPRLYFEYQRWKDGGRDPDMIISGIIQIIGGKEKAFLDWAKEHGMTTIDIVGNISTFQVPLKNIAYLFEQNKAALNSLNFLLRIEVSRRLHLNAQSPEDISGD